MTIFHVWDKILDWEEESELLGTFSTIELANKFCENYKISHNILPSFDMLIEPATVDFGL